MKRPLVKPLTPEVALRQIADLKVYPGQPVIVTLNRARDIARHALADHEKRSR